MKIIDKMPEDGQFVAAWVSDDGVLFADTLSHSMMGLLVFEPDGWTKSRVGPDFYEEAGAKYLVVEE